MSSEIVPINRTNTNSSTNNKNDYSFNAFNIAPGQDNNIRWLSRPNQQLVQQKYSHDTEKFRITFDVENFQPEQIKIYIQNGQLTISGVYEERSEGRFMQKQFERSFDIPSNADVDSMASYITPAHMLVVEIPLNPNPTPQVDHLSLNTTQNNQRRLSFSLNKYNTSNNQGLLSTSNELPAPGQSVRRTSVTKTTTTTTSTGSSGLPPEAVDLLRSVDTSTSGNSTQTYTSRTTERRSSNTNNQLTTSEPNTSSSTTKHTTLTTSELSDLPIDIPPELLTTGGTITIQKRRVSITKAADNSNTDQSVSVPLTQNNNTQSTRTTTTTTTTENTNQSGSVPINRNNDTQSSSTTTNTTNTTQNTNQTGEVTVNRNTNSNVTSSNTLNQQQSNLTERRGSKSSTSTQSNSVFTLEEFLQNKTWNPSLVDGPNGKKILQMRLQMKPGTKADQMKISLNGYDFRVEVDNKVTTEGGLQATEHSYRQVTLFPTCEIDQLTSELKDDGYLHIKVPINL